MNTNKLLVLVLMLTCMILSSCDLPTQMANPTETSQPKIDYVQGVGRILSSTPITVFPQQIHVGEDVLWYWFEECKCIVKFDPLIGKEVATVTVGNGKVGPYGNPKDLALDGTTIWVTDAGHFAVETIDPATLQIMDRIPLEFIDTGGKARRAQPFGLAVDDTTLWASYFDGNYVVRVDKETKKIVAVIPGIRNPEGMALSSGAVWVVEHRSGRVIRIDPATNEITAAISIPVTATAAFSGACGMCIDYVVATEAAVWVPLNNGYGVARIDPETNKVSAVIKLDGAVHHVAVSKNAVWVVGSPVGPDCAHEPGFLARIDPHTNQVVGTIPISCAYSVAVYDGSVWVGSGLPTRAQLIRVEPD